MGRLVPRLPDDVERKIATVVARSKICQRAAESGDLAAGDSVGQRTSDRRDSGPAVCGPRRVYRSERRPCARSWNDCTISPLMRRSDGAIGVLESNCGQGYLEAVLDGAFHRYIAVGKIGDAPSALGGLVEGDSQRDGRRSRVGRSARVGFDNIKNNFSKVIVHETGVKDSSPDARGILDDEEIEGARNAWRCFEETLSPRTV